GLSRIISCNGPQRRIYTAGTIDIIDMLPNQPTSPTRRSNDGIRTHGSRSSRTVTVQGNRGHVVRVLQTRSSELRTGEGLASTLGPRRVISCSGQHRRIYTEGTIDIIDMVVSQTRTCSNRR